MRLAVAGVSRRTPASSPAMATRSNCQPLPEGPELPAIGAVSVLGGVTSGLPVSAATAPLGVDTEVVSAEVVSAEVVSEAIDVVSADVVSEAIDVVSADVVSEAIDVV
ncbi:MAG TPA: hypothetical protein VIK13_11755, partial [Candidatus Limnocylindrales bacterium]